MRDPNHPTSLWDKLNFAASRTRLSRLHEGSDALVPIGVADEASGFVDPETVRSENFRYEARLLFDPAAR